MRVGGCGGHVCARASVQAAIMSQVDASSEWESLEHCAARPLLDPDPYVLRFRAVIDDRMMLRGASKALEPSPDAVSHAQMVRLEGDAIRPQPPSVV